MTAVDDVRVERAAPSDIAEAVALYRAVGWNIYADDPDTLAAALRGSTCVITASRGTHLVGLARVVSDGATIAYLQDVLVHPAHRRSGIGRRLVVAAFEPFAHVRQKVLLTDDEPGQRAFYEDLGFTEAHEHPDAALRSFVRFD